ncbi:MAG TPA: DUF2785 domain-containing protein [Sporichthyaceae bacterium]|nr:DUF2785 domain-containing protein [Sporichthyaceae bacterium]
MTDVDPRARAETSVDMAFWDRVVAADHALPADRRPADLAVELVELLGATDPHLRDDLGLGVLSTWVSRGVYDDLLPGLGDGLSDRLRAGLGEDGTWSVLRRSFSAAALAAVLERDNVRPRVAPETVLAWGDHGLAWLLAERDLRSHIPGAGRVQAVAHGADLIGALARSRHLGEGGLMVLLDTVADRLLAPAPAAFAGREEDRLAAATMALLHRDAVGLDVLEPWVERMAAGWSRAADPVPASVVNTVAYARALHLQLLLGTRPPSGVPADLYARPPAVRVDLLALLQAALRSSGPFAVRSAL